MAKRLDAVEQSFWDTIRQNNLIEKGDKIVIGVSGGPDSVTLLHCFYKYKKELECEFVVAHINHLIRKDSTDDEKFVENLCKKIGIECFIKRAEVDILAQKEKRSTEEMGRIIRYDFFDEIAKQESANKIAIAHNMNDNAETMLLNLIRGAGLNGLEGIQPMQYKRYIRPLINCYRKNIEAYCVKNNLQPRIDSTNKENFYTRNKIRNLILPKIEELNPNLVQTLSRTSKLIAENNEYVETETKKVFKKIANLKDGLIEIELKELNKLPMIIKRKVILETIEKLQGNTKNIQKSNIDDVIKLAEQNIGKKEIQLNKKISVKILKQKLITNLNKKN